MDLPGDIIVKPLDIFYIYEDGKYYKARCVHAFNASISFELYTRWVKPQPSFWSFLYHMGYVKGELPFEPPATYTLVVNDMKDKLYTILLPMRG